MQDTKMKTSKLADNYSIPMWVEMHKWMTMMDENRELPIYNQLKLN